MRNAKALLLSPTVACVTLFVAFPAFAHGNASMHHAKMKCPAGEHYQAMGKGSMRTGSCVAE